MMTCNSALKISWLFRSHFTQHSEINYFKDRGSSIFVSALDIPKAFDTINHYELYAYLINKKNHKWILTLAINCYSKLSVVVGWKTAIANAFYASYESSGVRQGRSLSPLMFTLFCKHIYCQNAS